MGKYGEIVCGHYGEYKSRQYPEGRIGEEELGRFWQYTKHRPQYGKSFVLVLGEKEGIGYVWAGSSVNHQKAGVSDGYQHIVYTEYSYEALKEAEWLPDFPFFGAQECREYLSGKKSWRNGTGRIGIWKSGSGRM